MSRSWFQRQQTCPTCRLNILRTPITSTQAAAPQPANNNNNNINANQNVRQNADQPQNPFLNLLNQAAAMGNQQQSSAGTSAVPTANMPAFNLQNMPTAGAPLPPFFFPSPFMTPFSIPPPPMPQNLEQLSAEELRALEGNERKHVEERLKLLKNINTMINASVVLMNQYNMVMANLPPIPLQQQSGVSSSNQQPSTSTSASSSFSEVPKKDEEKSSPVSSTSEVKIDTSKVKIEDVGSEEDEDRPKKPSSFEPSSSKVIASSSTSTLDSPSSSSASFIANESVECESNEANEIRKRRLQKFLPTN